MSAGVGVVGPSSGANNAQFLWPDHTDPGGVQQVRYHPQAARQLTDMKTTFAILFLVAIGCLQARGALADPATWSDFAWGETKRGNQMQNKRGAVVVPVAIKGCSAKLYAQLDTGAPRSIFFGNSLKVLRDNTCADISTEGPEEATTSGFRLIATAMQIRVGNFDAGNARVDYIPDYGEIEYFGEGDQKGLVVGVVGLNVFEKTRLLIDFPAKRFLVLGANAPIPSDLAGRTKYTEASVRDGMFLVPISVDFAPMGEFMYDTGSSLTFLEVSKAVWQKIAAKTGAEPDVLRRTVQGWKPLTIVESRFSGKVAVGTLPLGDAAAFGAVVTYRDNGPDSREGDSVPSFGVIGNAFFYDRYVVIFDFVQQRFGLAVD